MQDEALEYCDGRQNGHLHVACSAHAEGQEEEKRELILALLSLGFILEDKNLDGKTCLDLTPQYDRIRLKGAFSLAGFLFNRVIRCEFPLFR